MQSRRLTCNATTLAPVSFTFIGRKVLGIQLTMFRDDSWYYTQESLLCALGTIHGAWIEPGLSRHTPLYHCLNSSVSQFFSGHIPLHSSFRIPAKCFSDLTTYQPLECQCPSSSVLRCLLPSLPGSLKPQGGGGGGWHYLRVCFLGFPHSEGTSQCG